MNAWIVSRELNAVRGLIAAFQWIAPAATVGTITYLVLTCASAVSLVDAGLIGMLLR
jgi:hypothetical protein